MKPYQLSNQLQGLLNICAKSAQSCVLCGAGAGVRHVCAACVAALPRLSPLRCPVCDAPAAAALACPSCRKHPPHYARLLAAWPYAFPLDALVRQCKYRHDLRLIAALGELMLTGLHDRLGPDTLPDLIVPLPLAASRLATRGFNQSRELAQRVARGLGCRLDEQLIRIRDTPPQAGLKLAARRRNVAGAFAANARLDGLCVAIVDDVATSGATLSAAARALRQAGAARVEGWVLARTPPPGA